MSERIYQSITLESVDAAIIDWFDKTVDAHVEQNGDDRKKVPVRLASGERWITSRERKGMRDKHGKLILPIITIRRTTIDPDAGMSSLGIEVPKLQIAKLISPKTNNLQNLNKAASPAQKFHTDPVVYEVTTIPFPERKVLNYELQIQTQYQTHMNSILEKIYSQIEVQNSFVAPLENNGRQPPGDEPRPDREKIQGQYVVGFFDASNGDAGNLDEFTDQERIVRYTSSIRVPAVLQLDPEGKKPAVKVERTAFGLSFGKESCHFVDDPYELELLFSQGKIREK